MNQLAGSISNLTKVKLSKIKGDLLYLQSLPNIDSDIIIDLHIDKGQLTTVPSLETIRDTLLIVNSELNLSMIDFKSNEIDTVISKLIIKMLYNQNCKL